jgi:hypothetical protein
LTILFRPFGFIAGKPLNYLAFQSFDFERHLMNVIPETCHAHYFDIYIFIPNLNSSIATPLVY